MDGVGIPQYFGLYYAMGKTNNIMLSSHIKKSYHHVILHAAIALFVEGVMSGTYHICPNKANFQFGKQQQS